MGQGKERGDREERGKRGTEDRRAGERKGSTCTAKNHRKM